MNCIFPGAVALILLAMAAPAAAQYVDPRTCDPGTAACDSAIRTQRDNDAAYEEQARKNRAERERQRAAMLDKPPVPAKHNGLLGSWRLANSPQTSKGGLGREAGTGGLTDLVGILGSMNFATLACAPLSGGVSFGPSSYSRQGIDGRAQGAIAYRSVRSGAAPVIAAIPADGGVMVFEVASPDRIVGDDGCVLVRVGASAVDAPAARWAWWWRAPAEGAATGARVRFAGLGSNPSTTDDGNLRPSSRWMACRRGISSALTSEIAKPARPARPVRPMRWT